MRISCYPDHIPMIARLTSERGLTHIFFVAFLIIFFFFIPSTLNCLMIELHDFIKFAFKHGYPSIMTGLEILRLDLGGLESTFFNLFLIIFFS